MNNILKINKKWLYLSLIRNIIIICVLLFGSFWYNFIWNNNIVIIIYFVFFFLLVVIPNILLFICYYHDRKIELMIDEDNNVFYYETNKLIYKFNISDIVSISYFTALKFGNGYSSLNVKNEINIYVSNLIDISFLIKNNSKIEIENEVIFFFEELWNPIYKVENQLRLLNNKDL